MIKIKFNNYLSVATLLISLYSLYQSKQIKKEQSKLEKEMQNNEFVFSKKKIWYDKQRDVLDTSIKNLIQMRSSLGTFKLLFKKEISHLDVFTLKDSTEIRNILESIKDKNHYIESNIHYFPKSMEKNIDSIINSLGYLIIKLDPKINASQRIDDDEINEHIQKISTEISEMSDEIRFRFLD